MKIFRLKKSDKKIKIVINTKKIKETFLSLARASAGAIHSTNTGGSQY